jgi:galactokinase
MVGGGFGGSAIALATHGQIEAIKGAITNAFIEESFIAPRFFTSLPSGGAKVIKQLVR